MTMMTMTSNEEKRYTRGVAFVLGIVVLLAFTVFLVAAAPGKATLSADGYKGEPVSELRNIYSLNNMKCALASAYCDLTG